MSDDRGAVDLVDLRVDGDTAGADGDSDVEADDGVDDTADDERPTVVFLGANNVGLEVYDWLCDRESVDVLAMLTEKSQLPLVERLHPDFVVACGFTHIVPPTVLAVPERGCLNLHPGLLPYARGYNPNVWSIVDDVPAGVTLHYMDDGVDTGPVVATREVEAHFDDTGKTLYDRLERATVDLFAEAWPGVEDGTATARDQDDSLATTHYKREFVDLCELDPDEELTTKELLDRLRALTFPPFDNARIDVDGETYYVEVSITHEDDTESGDDGRLSSY
ncbi:formyltransferase family protein [Halomarina oriensis]|uniref:phosphoribosylglycinamide formyltransferase 1 n=1 Tax=Halomarina oriensis TaxID=671145 RepID=A0A6B0GX21_9EURY|nr:formyltransferase family protein [Halomarina oriensis]MWG36308.1 formyl transferase [Halomarina oriensis]